MAPVAFDSVTQACFIETSLVPFSVCLLELFGF